MLFPPHHGDPEQAWLMLDLSIKIKAEGQCGILSKRCIMSKHCNPATGHGPCKATKACHSWGHVGNGTHVIQHVLTPLTLTHYRLAIWRGGFAYRIREPSGIRMWVLGLCHVPRVAGIHCIICWRRPLSQAQS